MAGSEDRGSSVTCARDPRGVSSPNDSVGSGGGSVFFFGVIVDPRPIDVARESTLATLSSADTLTGGPIKGTPSKAEFNCIACLSSCPLRSTYT